MEESLIKNEKSFEDEKKKELEKVKLSKKISKLSYTRDGYNDAGCCNKMFFCWAYKIIKLGNITPIEKEHLGVLEGRNTSSYYTETLKNTWFNKKYNQVESNGLFKALTRTKLCGLMLTTFLSLVTSVTEFAVVILFREYIVLFEDDKDKRTEWINPMTVGSAFIALKLFGIFILRHTNNTQYRLGYEATTGLNCLIYDKLLRLSPSSSGQKFSEGQIINFIQVDSPKIKNLMMFSPLLLAHPIQIVVYMYMLFVFFGMSFLFGLGTLILFLIFNFCFQKKFVGYSKQILEYKDTRMKLITETIHSLKTIKLYGWDEEYMNQTFNVRDKELHVLKKDFYLWGFNNYIDWVCPIAVSVVAIGAYQYFVESLSLADMLTCINIFNRLQQPIRALPWIYSLFLQTAVSLNRIEEFLKADEIDNTRMIRYDPETEKSGIAIKVENGNFSWGSDALNEEEMEVEKKKAKERKKQKLKKQKKKEKENTKHKTKPRKNSLVKRKGSTSSKDHSKKIEIDESGDKTEKLLGVEDEKMKEDTSQENISIISGKEDELETILHDINIEIFKKELICIVGEVGSGKSSFLQAILNNMLVVKEKKGKKTQMFVNGKISYISQVPWIRNATIKDNIIFYKEFNSQLYRKVLNVCELNDDLEAIVGGDMAEIGEKGINLSGGQKARISIARALYAESDIYIFDDSLSALDAHVGRKIMENVILGFLCDKTRIVVTHALQYLPNFDKVMYFYKGRLLFYDTFSVFTKHDYFKKLNIKNVERSNEINDTFQNSLELSKSEVNENESTLALIDKKKENEKNEEEEVTRITKDEDREVGKVKFSTYINFFRYYGGIFVFIFILILMILWQGLKIASDYWITIWSKKDRENSWLYYGIYSGLGISSTLFICAKTFIVTYGSIRCSKIIFEKMLRNVLKAPINLFHDTTPKGQILNRLSRDLNEVDNSILGYYDQVFDYFFSFAGAIFVCSYYMIWAILFLPFLLITGTLMIRFYIPSSRDLARLEALSKTPILNSLSETYSGNITIRSFEYQHFFQDVFYERVDEYKRTIFFWAGTYNWFGLHMDLLSFLFTVFLVVFTIVFESQFDGQMIGLMFIYALSLQNSLFNLLNTLSGFETTMVSFERCFKYTDIKPELPDKLPIDTELVYWPENGKIEFINYSVRYRPDTEVVLKNLNFCINPGEKIGVVGRTGSGKSTLCLCLFRILEALEGSIKIDSVDISEVGLLTLRKKLTIIPQDPILIEGTLRNNIDPINNCTDEKIIEVLNKVGIGYLIDESSQGINIQIAEGGSNLSVGERQLLCFARAILRESKVIIMDEATANIDVEKEEQIQKLIHTVFSKCTVITIAHRVKTIVNSDRILVMSKGEAVEFDSPNVLLENKNSIFYDYYQKSSL